MKGLGKVDISLQIFNLSADVRYVALYRNGKLDLEQRDDLQSASSSESDKYEELIVNPTLLTLARQRGNIDCGGASFVVIGYGNFQQLVIALNDGHVSVAFEKTAHPQGFVEQIRSICDR